MHVPKFRCPPHLTRDDGQERRVGLEIEFAGIPLDDAIDTVTDLFGGSASCKSRFECAVEGARFGDFRVEIDSKPLLGQKYVEYLNWFGLGGRTRDLFEDALVAIARAWIPCEIITPPIPLGRLPEFEALRLALHRRGALGTRRSIVYGFAFQLNPEVPSFEASSILRHLQAFVLLHPWLVDVCDVDVTRKVGPFIVPFPESYRRKILARDYAPDLDELIDDYLLDNPTRNRPLDMLPLFAHLRPEKVASVVGTKAKVHTRPTFHYRLPNCLVDEPDWSFAVEWNRWCEVERLADEPRRLRALSSAYLDRPARSDLARRAWISEVAHTISG